MAAVPYKRGRCWSAVPSHRAVLRECLSRVIASPSVEKGVAILASLSRPCLWPARLWKRLALCEALLFLWCAHGGKGSDDRKPFSPLPCGRHVFGSALPCAKHYPSFGARTGRARQNCCARPKGKAKAIHWRGAFGEWTPSGNAKAIHWRGTPTAPRQRQSKWIAHAPRANRFAVRAPCAHPRWGIGQALGKALPKTRRHRRGERKVGDSHIPFPCRRKSPRPSASQKSSIPPQTFFNFFLSPPCAGGRLLLHLHTSAVGRAFRRGAGVPHSPSD